MIGMLLLLACDAGHDTALVNGGEPYVAILEPLDEETVCGDPLRVVVDVANFELVEPVEDPAQAESGTGHVDIMLNGHEKRLDHFALSTLHYLQKIPRASPLSLANGGESIKPPL